MDHTQPGLLLWPKIRPSRRVKDLPRVSDLLDLAGALVLTTAANLSSRPLILACLVLAELHRQSKRRLPPV
jgi:hypothetical protein